MAALLFLSVQRLFSGPLAARLLGMSKARLAGFS